jgi:alkanesulfonate monooxygenase SsuD/methylene tetrahydromethanopterin reductase-like flavin-dependent oxidoreductase (luciferase family)
MVKGLWDSWDDDAFVRNKQTGVFFDPNKVHYLDHKERFFSVRGPLNCPRPPQGHPVIFQAGFSNAGRELAAQSAEGVFTSGSTFESQKDHYDDVKARMKKYGRETNQMVVLPGLTPIIGRTDALAAVGRDEAIRRASRYREAGVDLVFVDAMKTIADAAAVAREVPGPLMISIVEGHETTRLLPQDLKSLGYALALYPLSPLFAATRAVTEVLRSLRRDGSTLAEAGRMATYAEFSEWARLDHFCSLDERFGVVDASQLKPNPTHDA